MQSGKGGASINYKCSLLYIDSVIQVRIPELNFHKVDTNGISGSFNVSNDVTLEVNIDADDEITLSFESISCPLEGSLTVAVNNETLDSITLRIVGK